MKRFALFSFLFALPLAAQNWMTMVHGSAFINQVVQSGPRGGDKFFSTNWLMGTAERPLGDGHLLLRAMLSLEPATITDRRYPELFQTGETAFGRPLRDAQHPHDFFMELAAQYSYKNVSIYVAPVGSPALGPVAFPHRASAAEIPQATIAHHWEDSTHIAYNVITVGAKQSIFTAEASAFHGGEPDEHRWDIDGGRIDSWSVRLTANPTPQWSAQISTGHLKKPEALEPGDVQRTTASVSYTIPNWSSTLIFGRNRGTNGWTAETLWTFAPKNYLTARAEVVGKDELSVNGTFRIKALTAGYTRDVWSNDKILAGVGGNVTI